MLPLVRMAMDALMAWLSPPRCAACGRPIGPRERWFCAPCAASLLPLEGPRCRRCGGPSSRGSCPACRRAPPPFRSADTLYAYGGALAQVVRRYKYGGHLELARPLGDLLATVLGAPELLVVPIPSSRDALARRGFDPMMEILRAGPRVRWAPILVRVDRRPAQAGLPAAERRTLGMEAFRLRPGRSVGGAPLCLVDDVFTTGATLRAAAAALRAAGASAVDVVTLARSEGGAADPIARHLSRPGGRATMGVR